MVGIDTEKVFATSSLGIPASTAESTLNLSGLSNMASYSEANTQINTYGHRCSRDEPGVRGTPLDSPHLCQVSTNLYPWGAQLPHTLCDEPAWRVLEIACQRGRQRRAVENSAARSSRYRRGLSLLPPESRRPRRSCG